MLQLSLVERSQEAMLIHDVMDAIRTPLRYRMVDQVPDMSMMCFRLEYSHANNTLLRDWVRYVGATQVRMFPL